MTKLNELEREWLRPSEAASMLGITRQTLAKNMQHVMTVKLPTGAFLINRESLNRWLTERAVQAATIGVGA
jgi:hypothetical protein